jgi:predicted permease
VGQAPIAYYQGVSPEFFQTLDIRLVQGRTFASTDATYAPAVAVINETMARRLWPDESPLGKHIGSLHPQMGYQRGVEIVGVVRDVRFAANLAEPDTHLQVYRPLAQEPRGAVAIALRCVGAVENLPEALRGAVAELDSALPVHEVSTARQACERLLANFSLLGSLLAGFALLGLMLAALGIYGVITAFVLQRTNEIGIRFALGAQVRDILGLVLGLGLRLCVAGLLIGLVGAFGIERLLQSVVPELPSRDPVTLAAVGSTLIAIALLACWLPARRAAKVDPMEALRYE